MIVPLWAWLGVYTLTGVLQPISVDFVRYNGALGSKVMLIPMLCNTLGMWLASSFSMLCGLDTEQHPRPSLSKAVVVAAVLDFSSGLLVMLGLLSVGSAEFAVIYSSCTAWTAVLSWICGIPLKPQEWAGVVLVTLGLLLNAAVKQEEGQGVDSSSSVIGSLVLLAGTILHSACFVYNEIKLNDEKAKLSPQYLCSMMGKLESLVLMAWNVLLQMWFQWKDGLGARDLAFVAEGSASAALSYLFLICNNSLHALSFFAMLNKVGAVSMGIMKGTISVCTLLLASGVYCGVDSSQCLTYMKGFCMFLIVCGSITFANAKVK